jgi:ABC-2 type transport system ATP-binding protein
MSSDVLVSAEDLVVRRGDFTLTIPRWEVRAGEVVGLVGPNGAGKTTLLETLPGLRPRDGGSLSVFGLNPWDDPVGVRSSLGFMTDDLPLFAMRIDRLLRTLSGYYPTWDAELVEMLLDRFDLSPSRKVWELSRGEGTRLRLITAMAFRPKLLVLDEPAAGLDLAGRRSLIESVLDVVRDPQRSVVFSSHALHDVERIADRLLVLSRGRVVRDGATDALIGDGRTLEEALEAWGAV